MTHTSISSCVCCVCSKLSKRSSCSVRVFVPCCLRNGDLDPWTTGGVEVPTTAVKTRSHKNALDAILTIFYQHCSDMQLDVGQKNIVQCSCAESNLLSSRTHRHVFVSRAFVQVMRTISSRSISLVVGGACAGDGPLRPVSCNMTRL